MRKTQAQKDFFCAQRQKWKSRPKASVAAIPTETAWPDVPDDDIPGWVHLACEMVRDAT
jgi:hypothetical protein